MPLRKNVSKLPVLVSRSCPWRSGVAVSRRQWLATTLVYTRAGDKHQTANNETAIIRPTSCLRRLVHVSLAWEGSIPRIPIFHISSFSLDSLSSTDILLLFANWISSASFIKTRCACVASAESSSPVRQEPQKMTSPRAHLQLGNSWVVEGEDEGYQETSKENDPDYVEPPPSRKAGRPTETTARTRSHEPELIMPRLDSRIMDGLRAAEHVQSSSRSPRTAEKARERRKRRTRQDDSSGSSTPEEKVVSRTVRNIASAKPATGEDFVQVLGGHLAGIASWTLEVLGRALRLLKIPISFVLAIWMLLGIGLMVRNLITTSIQSSLSPICRIPGASYLNLPFCPARPYRDEEIPPVEFDRLMTVQNKFEEVLEESAGSVSLPMDMKRGEASIRDLRQLVRYSQLNSKGELVLEFDGFIDTARIASYDLQKFNSHIGRAVDNVLATTRWTTRVLDGIQLRDAQRGAIASFVEDNLLAPFQPTKFTESALLDQYIKHTSIIEEEIHRLIDEAQALLMVLANLEDRLEIIHGIVTRDKNLARAKKEEILSELWSLVGGNRGRVKKMDRQLALLQQVGVYRKSAYAHVSGTILKLQAIGAGLEDLRERVGSPELLRDRIDVPLSVHIENIQRGVERLEEGRQSAKKVENEHIRHTLERAQAIENRLIEG